MPAVRPLRKGSNRRAACAAVAPSPLSLTSTTMRGVALAATSREVISTRAHFSLGKKCNACR